MKASAHASASRPQADSAREVGTEDGTHAAFDPNDERPRVAPQAQPPTPSRRCSSGSDPAYVLLMPMPHLVAFSGVTVVTAFRCGDALVLTADQSQSSFDASQPPKFAPLADTRKLVAGTHVAAALAGIRSSPDGTHDLLRSCASAVAGAHEVEDAAFTLASEFQRTALDLHITAQLAFPVNPFSKPMASIAVLAGAHRSGPAIEVVGIDLNGRITVSPIDEDPYVVAPDEVFGPFTDGVEKASKLPLAECLDALDVLHTELALVHPLILSPLWTGVVVKPDGLCPPFECG